MIDALPPSLDFLEEPALVLRPDGTILVANAPARRTLGDGLAGQAFADYVEDAIGSVAAYLRLAGGSTAPIPGGLTLLTTAGVQRTRVQAARLPGDAPLLVLRCRAMGEDRFDVLARRVRELDDQLRLRLREKAMLEKALSENSILLQELQHRVRNTIQMLMTLLKLSARKSATPEVVTLVGAAELYLHAMAVSQDALIRADDGYVAIGPMLDELMRTAYADRRRIDVEFAGDAGIALGSAHCLALIFVGLVGRPQAEGGLGRIRVDLRIDGGRARLSVERPDGSDQIDHALLRSLVAQMGAVHLRVPLPDNSVSHRLDFPVRALRDAA